MRAIVAFLVLCSVASAEPFLLEGHSVVYLPETDEVRLTARFNQPLDFWTVDNRGRSKHGIAMYVVHSKSPVTLGNAIRTTSILDEDVVSVVAHGVDVMGRFPYRVEGNSFSTVVPFDLLDAPQTDFDYRFTATEFGGSGGNSRFGVTQIGVPEPSTIALASIALLLLCQIKRAKRQARQRHVGLVGDSSDAHALGCQ